MKILAAAAVFLLFPILMAGCATLTGRTAGEIIDDATITTMINAKIIEDPELHYLKIDVNSTEGNVVLTGFIPNEKAGERLVNLARAVKGVKSVKSLLTIEKK